MHAKIALMDADTAPLKHGSVAMQFTIGGKLVTQWNVEDVTLWLTTIGLPEVVQNFREHSVTGSVLHRINDDYLQEMGIYIIGYRLKLMNEVFKVQSISRTEWRNTIIWTQDQYRAGPCNNTLPYGFPFPCESCVGIPDKYKSTNSKINILTMVKNCNTPCTACCGFTMVSINIDLSNIKDIDTAGSTGILGDPEGKVVIIENDNKTIHQLTLRSSECQKVTAILTNAKEEAIIRSGIGGMQMLR